MNLKNQQLPIGVFDSGVGGISTLAYLTKHFPHEKFIFYGDSLHAPYGSRTKEEVLTLSTKSIQILLEKKVKAIVIACNTATSAAKTELMTLFPEVILIGIEPALKEAVDHGAKNILVMGTELTLKLEKFNRLLETYGSKTTVQLLPCPGLAKAVETDLNDRAQIRRVLAPLLAPYKKQPIDAVVLGCTHYPFVQEIIQELLETTPTFYTGYAGVATHLEKQLQTAALLTDASSAGTVNFFSSQATPEEIQQYQQYFNFYKQKIE